MSRHDDLEYPDEYLEYFICAKEFGWTTEQVDSTPAHALSWIMAIQEIMAEKENERVGQYP